MSSPIEIQRLKFRHIVRLATVFSDALESDFDYIIPEERSLVRRQNSSYHLFIAYLKPRRHIFTAWQNGHLIGYVIAGTELDGSGNIDWLYVESTTRGANIGLRLLSRAMRHLHEQGATYVTLETYAYTKYYARQGFYVVRKVKSNGIEQDLMRFDF